MKAGERVAARFTEWALARWDRLEAQRRRDTFVCEVFDESEPETGYQGTPRCWQSGLVNQDDVWCPTCQQRDLVFAEMLRLRMDERRALVALRRTADAVGKRASHVRVSTCDSASEMDSRRAALQGADRA